MGKQTSLSKAEQREIVEKAYAILDRTERIAFLRKDCPASFANHPDPLKLLSGWKSTLNESEGRVCSYGPQVELALVQEVQRKLDANETINLDILRALCIHFCHEHSVVLNFDHNFYGSGWGQAFAKRNHFPTSICSTQSTVFAKNGEKSLRYG